jgi:hypothetical protein
MLPDEQYPDPSLQQQQKQQQQQQQFQVKITKTTETTTISGKTITKATTILFLGKITTDVNSKQHPDPSLQQQQKHQQL